MRQKLTNQLVLDALAPIQEINKHAKFRFKMATAMERKFTGLRKRLDQLGYRQPLGVESLPLVERLFGDLLHTTESLKNAKLQLGKHKEQKGKSLEHGSIIIM